MPAMNAAATLSDTAGSIPRDWVDEVILVDDHSTDATVELARRLPMHVIWHPHNAGYGANRKTCYMEALQRGADVVVMLHPDGQYEPALIPRMVEPILAGRADLALGSRLAEPGMALRHGMPRWKYVANRALTIVENRVLGTQLTLSWVNAAPGENRDRALRRSLLPGSKADSILRNSGSHACLTPRPPMLRATRSTRFCWTTLMLAAARTRHLLRPAELECVPQRIARSAHSGFSTRGCARQSGSRGGEECCRCAHRRD